MPWSALFTRLSGLLLDRLRFSYMVMNIENQPIASVYGGQHASAHVISRVFSVIFNRRTSLYASFIFLENP